MCLCVRVCFCTELPMDKISRRHFGNDVPPLAELKKNTSLILVNSHVSLNFPRPTVPGFIDVAGLHIHSKGKLPDDLETFIDESKDGVIYFCLGSLVRPETLPRDKLEAFISVFSELPQRVIWKTNNIPGLPKNIRASKWLPQFDILSHPNVRVFMTHGGLMGTQEAVQAGVPMVGIPLFADQELNIRNCVSKGTAVMVLYDDVTKDSILSALQTVLHDPSYQKNAKELSRRFRDRPQSPLETAIFWTEYVIRHRGASHLRSAAVDLTWYQYLLLDVMTVIVMFVVVMLATTYFILKKLISICSGSLTKKVKTS
ncbi:UDP-glucuronosyltransferase 2C1-like isoform X3 [Zootermopsis nevadensis]|uniref:UDP-glucuronosyltransferase 2C1-like isoform X3 n=1 Tax=Zootermopsis nevadensis TaxID=136037 RepID=UPI000B8E8C4C|nr:UDP-glucuronosyltransferase 2C1-like isoform X3 [Zootermopsis nevadensis]